MIKTGCVDLLSLNLEKGKTTLTLSLPPTQNPQLNDHTLHAIYASIQPPVSERQQTPFSGANESRFGKSLTEEEASGKLRKSG